MNKKYIALVLFLFFHCAAPQRPDADAVIQRGDNIIKKADALEKKYKQNPSSVTIQEIDAMYVDLRESWNTAKEVIKSERKYSDYWKNQYDSNAWFSNVGKWTVGTFIFIAIAGLLYGALRLYLRFGTPTGILSKLK